jgi:pimeloyl-ACP methyl ester carboxylesterase
VTVHADIDAASGHVIADGHRLRVQHIQGPAGRPTLVFLHEGLGSIPQWRDFPAKACAIVGLPGLVYERCGHGGSDPVTLPRPDDFLHREAERVLPAVLAACGIGRHVLLGHSDGGTAALIYAALYPQRPMAVITMAAHVMMEATTREALAGVAERWRSDPQFAARLARYHGGNTDSLLSGWLDVWMRESMRNWSIVGCLSRITCPLLAIQGECDEHGSWHQVEAIVEGTSGPAEAFRVPACGHVPHLEAGAIVLERVKAFLDTLPLAPGQEE